MLPFRIRLWWHESVEWLAWRAAWALPRYIALLAFVRVCSATGDSPDDIRYGTAYKAWERGAGR